MSTQGAADVSLPVLKGPAPIRKSRNAKWRALVLGAIQVLIVVHIIHWKVTGSTISPVEPSESMEFVKRGAVNAGLVFFVVALLATLVFGRWFCGWGCHLVMLQDLCGWMLRKVGIKPKPFRSRLLIYVPFILALYMFVWPAVYRWGVVPLSIKLNGVWEWVPALAEIPWGGIKQELTTDDFWSTFAGWIVAIPFLGICGFATVYFLGNKGFCTYGCPYGGFFAPLDQYAPGRIRVTDACQQCGHCTAVCSSNVRVHEEVKAYGMVVDPGCMKTSDCISVCPNNALYFGFGRPASAKKTRSEPRKCRPDLSWAEEIALALVFFGVFTSVRGVYGLVPMLMAVGIAGCMTFIVFKLWRMVRDASVSFHRFRLKYKGSITKSGWVFAALGMVLVALVVQSGVVRALLYRADQFDSEVTMPRHLVFAASPMELPEDMAASAERAIGLYERAGWIVDGGIGLFPNRLVDVRVAWLQATLHNHDAALARLERRIDRFGPAEGTCRDMALLLRMQMREDDARAFYAEQIAAHPQWVALLDDAVLWDLQVGRIDDAFTRTRAAVDEPTLDDAERLYVTRRLSLLELEYGNTQAGVDLIRETIEIDPNNPAARQHLAGGLLKLGQVEAAAATLEEAVERFPENANLLAAWAELLDSLGRPEEAAAIRARAEALHAGHAHGG